MVAHFLALVDIAWMYYVITGKEQFRYFIILFLLVFSVMSGIVSAGEGKSTILTADQITGTIVIDGYANDLLITVKDGSIGTVDVNDVTLHFTDTIKRE